MSSLLYGMLVHLLSLLWSLTCLPNIFYNNMFKILCKFDLTFRHGQHHNSVMYHLDVNLLMWNQRKNLLHQLVQQQNCHHMMWEQTDWNFHLCHHHFQSTTHCCQISSQLINQQDYLNSQMVHLKSIGVLNKSCYLFFLKSLMLLIFFFSFIVVMTTLCLKFCVIIHV